MNFLYNIIVWFAQLVLSFVALFDPKIKLFIDGRKETFSKLKNEISENDEVVWMHAASLGEFEQGRPIIEKLKEENPHKKLVVTFFSPSGYEIRKNYNVADVVCYLPLDSKSKMKQFLKIVHPELAIIVKYEFWPNLLKELKRRNTKTILVSGIFRKEQPFFKWYGGWMQKSLQAFSHFFVQDENSKQLLNSVGFKNVTISGDTRFDRVFEITEQNNKLDFVEEFKNNKHTVVVGSSWADDEKVLVNYINNEASEEEKFIIAPHNIKPNQIQELKNSIQKKVVLFSEKEHKNLSDFQVLIVDTIGILTKIYSYADVAYVGGGYTKSGVHNVLEPATFGVPIVIGPHFKKFKEAIELVENRACFSVDNSKKLSVLLKKFYQDKKELKKVGAKALKYVVSNKGATTKILKYISR